MVENPVVSQKIFKYKARFPESKILFPPLGVTTKHHIEEIWKTLFKSACSRVVGSNSQTSPRKEFGLLAKKQPVVV